MVSCLITINLIYLSIVFYFLSLFLMLNISQKLVRSRSGSIRVAWPKGQGASHSSLVRY